MDATTGCPTVCDFAPPLADADEAPIGSDGAAGDPAPPPLQPDAIKQQNPADAVWNTRRSFTRKTLRGYRERPIRGPKGEDTAVRLTAGKRLVALTDS